MSGEPVVKRSFLNFVGEKLYAILFKPGWQRWVVLAVAALVFILVALQLSSGTSYKEDPSALVPRSSQVYLETRDLDSLLRTVAAWKLWKPDRRAKGDEQRNQLQVDLAGLIGDQVAGLGTRLPLLWLVDAKQAAYCMNRDEEGKESWALFLRTGNSGEVLADIGVEPGMHIETVKGTAQQGVFKLTGTGTGELYFSVLDPWLVVSSQPTLPEFAYDSSRRPAFSLSRAGLLPNWRHGVAVRGLVNPVYQVEQSTSSVYGILSKWIDPDVRISFTSKIGRKGLETVSDADQLSERVRGGGLWPLFSILLAIIGLLALLIIFATILIMVGWGGWLKTAAMRAGIAPAKAPKQVEPSQAFKEDSGESAKKEVSTPAESVKQQAGASDESSSVPDPARKVESGSVSDKSELQADPAAGAKEHDVSEDVVEGQVVESNDVMRSIPATGDASSVEKDVAEDSGGATGQGDGHE